MGCLPGGRKGKKKQLVLRGRDNLLENVFEYVPELEHKEFWAYNVKRSKISGKMARNMRKGEGQLFQSYGGKQRATDHQMGTRKVVRDEGGTCEVCGNLFSTQAG